MSRKRLIVFGLGVIVITIVTGCKSKSGSPTLPDISPIVGAVSPNFGPQEGGTAVTIKGTSFVDGATVTFGGIAATGITVVDSATIAAITPAYQKTGAVSVAVTNPDGKSTSLADAFTYRIICTGTWTGTTSQGKKISIRVDEENVLKTFEIFFSRCNETEGKGIQQSIQINPDGSFSWSDDWLGWYLQGQFQSSSSAAGTYRENRSTPCVYDITVTWTAVK